jgi:hypothetical protein
MIETLKKLSISEKILLFFFLYASVYNIVIGKVLLGGAFAFSLVTDVFYKNSDQAKGWVLERVKDLKLITIFAGYTLFLLILYGAVNHPDDTYLVLLFGSLSLGALLHGAFSHVALRRQDVSSATWNNCFEFIDAINNLPLLFVLPCGGWYLAHIAYTTKSGWADLGATILIILTIALALSTANKIEKLPNGLKSRFSEF